MLMMLNLVQVFPAAEGPKDPAEFIAAALKAQLHSRRVHKGVGFAENGISDARNARRLFVFSSPFRTWDRQMRPSRGHSIDRFSWFCPKIHLNP
jgi:hypothetical protein